MMNRKLLIILTIGLFFVVFCKADAADPGGDGLSGTYQRNLEDLEILGTYMENINFPNFDSVLLSRIGQVDNARVVWKGEIYTPVQGSYKFSLDVVSREFTSLYISETEIWSGTGHHTKSMILSEGWHSFWMSAEIPSGHPDSQLELSWRKPDNSQEIIPKNYFNSHYWADDVITIPDVLSPRESLNFVISGVGAKNISNPVIEFEDLPEDILKDEIFVFWVYSRDNTITVTNQTEGISRTVTGTVATTPGGELVDVTYAKLPSELFPGDIGSDLRLSFSNISYNPRPAGIAVIIPYIDSDRPKGRISIVIDGRCLCDSRSYPFVFPIGEEALINTDIRPFFLLGDGSSKESSLYPNYLVMLSGEGPTPDQFPDTNLEALGAQKIVPRNLSCIDRNDPSTWYPVYGREGSELDVISPNYVPNQWNVPVGQGATDYVSPAYNDGYINSINIPEEHTWIAFQFVAGNFPEDCINGRYEYMFVIGGGVFAIRGILQDPLPAIPTNLSATSIECETANLVWEDNASNEEFFVLERKTSGEFMLIKDDILPNTEFYRDTAVGGEVTYTYRIRACHYDGCSDYSNETSVVTEMCSPPEDFTLFKSNNISAEIIHHRDTESSESIISASSLFGFTGDITLSVEETDFPDYSLSDTILTESEYSTGSIFKVDVPGDTAPGIYTIKVKGESAGFSPRTVDIYLTVKEIFIPWWREILPF